MPICPICGINKPYTAGAVRVYDKFHKYKYTICSGVECSGKSLTLKSDKKDIARARKSPMDLCRYCGEFFVRNKANQKYCTKSCQMGFNRIKKNEKSKNERIAKQKEKK